MQTFTITYDDGHSKATDQYTAPDRLPQPGDVYQWVIPTTTIVGKEYDTGDLMTVLGRTDVVPHFRTNSLGNLRVQCKHHESSVWTCFELMIKNGYLKLVEAKQ